MTLNFLKIQLGRVVEDFKLNLLVLKKMGFDVKNREIAIIDNLVFFSFEQSSKLQVLGELDQDTMLH
jgi:hypothetical protein